MNRISAKKHVQSRMLHPSVTFRSPSAQASRPEPAPAPANPHTYPRLSNPPHPARCWIGNPLLPFAAEETTATVPAAPACRWGSGNAGRTSIYRASSVWGGALARYCNNPARGGLWHTFLHFFGIFSWLKTCFVAFLVPALHCMGSRDGVFTSSAAAALM